MGFRDNKGEERDNAWSEQQSENFKKGFVLEENVLDTKEPVSNFSQLEKDFYNELINIDDPLDQRRVLNNIHLMIEDYYAERLEARNQDAALALKKLEQYRNGEKDIQRVQR